MIRPATVADIDAILAIWNPIIRNTSITFNSAEKTADEIAAMLAEKAAAGHAVFVAEAAGTVCGLAHYGQFRNGVGYARTMEHTIYMSPAARGQGLGRALMAAVTDHARAGGTHQMIAGISCENRSGLAFHRRLGFQEIAVLREVGWKFGRYMDLHLLGLAL